MIEWLMTFFGAQTTGELIWIALGFGGQLLFTGRFLVQWVASERAGRSTIPVAFWWLSISGGLVLLSYAIYRGDPVFILGQSMGVFIYSRNLWLINRERRELG
ncbi:lipid-A-disaccharide synthase N-terminal domain-containing protein [Falsihalocynthiibacter sp. SS001]|uniref:lipid-A-disaccharide synthase N-terminal domain-containing protein n=1 Tax=Falsihalocynthiibacter sp. SS001 TaxID=3349698 RepID=UPI0036D3B887